MSLFAFKSIHQGLDPVGFRPRPNAELFMRQAKLGELRWFPGFALRFSYCALEDGRSDKDYPK